MAEVICRDMIARRLRCVEERLREKGYDVFSAGVAAGDSFPASPEAVDVMKSSGLDLSQHLSRQITEEMLEESDLVLTLTPSHLQVLQSARPDLVARMRTLRADGLGISDPIGGGIAEYQSCAREIAKCVEDILGDHFGKELE